MEPREFCHHFGCAIRVQLDWKQFCSSNWPIEHQDSVIPSASANLYTPWYALVDGEPCAFDAAGAQPQSVAAAGRNTRLLLHHHVQTVAVYTGVLLLPAYRLNKGSVLLLDGNHRVVAAQVSSQQLRLALFVICGPISAAVLPDLRHWAGLSEDGLC